MFTYILHIYYLERLLELGSYFIKKKNLVVNIEDNLAIVHQQEEPTK